MLQGRSAILHLTRVQQSAGEAFAWTGPEEAPQPFKLRFIVLALLAAASLLAWVV
jgi:hypothetical protein